MYINACTYFLIFKCSLVPFEFDIKTHSLASIEAKLCECLFQRVEFCGLCEDVTEECLSFTLGTAAWPTARISRARNLFRRGQGHFEWDSATFHLGKIMSLPSGKLPTMRWTSQSPRCWWDWKKRRQCMMCRLPWRAKDFRHHKKILASGFRKAAWKQCRRRLSGQCSRFGLGFPRQARLPWGPLRSWIPNLGRGTAWHGPPIWISSASAPAAERPVPSRTPCWSGALSACWKMLGANASLQTWTSHPWKLSWAGTSWRSESWLTSRGSFLLWTIRAHPTTPDFTQARFWTTCSPLVLYVVYVVF